MLEQLLAVVGIYAIALWSYETWLASLVELVLGLSRDLICNRKSLAERYGQWAVITGATDGIGKSYAENLARKGMNVVLISRSEDKLRAVSREIQDVHGVQVKIIVADFSVGYSIYSHIRKELSGVDIGILVNNVGTAVDRLDYFEKYPDQVHLQLSNVNMLSVLLMTHMVLPRMKQLRRGLIVNISSIAVYYSPPFLATYAATKSFGHSLALTLQQELRGTGVELQLMVPHVVRTNINAAWDVSRYGGRLIPDARSYGRWATWMIGKTNHSCGHWFHSVQILLQQLLPACILKATMRYILEGFIKQQNNPSF